MSSTGRRGLVFVALAMVVAGLGVFGVWRLVGSRGGGEGEAAQESENGTGRGARLVKGTGTTWGEEEPAGEANGVIEGVVLDADGKPVDGARVILGRARGRNEETPSLSFLQPKGVATTADGGRFRVEALAPGDYGATAVKEGWAPAQKAPIAVKARETARIELKLPRGGFVVSGRVLDVDGGTVAGARVTAAMRSAGGGRAPMLLQSVAGPDGQYRLIVGRGPHGLRAEADGYATSNEELFVVRSTTRDLRLVPAARLSGMVVEMGSKRPVGDAEVSLTSGMRGDFRAPREGKSDGSGRFEFTDLEPGSYEVMARKGALIGAGKVVALAPAQSVTGVEVEVERGRTVSGRVKSDTGAGIGNVRVSAGRDTPPFGQAARTRSNPDGSYALEGMLPGNYRISASEEGYGQASARARVLNGDVGNVDLVLPPGVKVTGRVVTAAGQPVEGARVQGTYETRTGAGGMTMSGDTTTTAADGSFELKRVAPGTLRVTARHEEQGMRNQGPEEVKAGEHKVLTLVLEKGATVSGTVRTEDGRPAPDVRVTSFAREARMFGESNDVTGPDGRYRLTGLAAGRVMVSAERSGRPSFSFGSEDEAHQKTLTLAANEDKAGVDLVVAPAGQAIKGVVVGADGKAVPGAIVTAGVERGGGRAFRGASRDLKAYSNLDGHFSLENVSKGSYTLWASHPEFPEAEVTGVQAAASAVKIQFPPDTTISGVVVGPEGKPIPHYSITIVPGPKTPDEKPIDRQRRQRVSFDANVQRVQNPGGAFELRKMAAGNHELLVSAPSGESGTQVVAVAAGERKTGVRIQLQAGVRVIGKVLELGTNKVIPGVLVSAMGRGNARAEAEVGPDGNFTIDGAPAGENVRISVSPDTTRHVSEFKEVEAKAGQTTIDAGTIKLLPGNQRDRMMGDMAERGQTGAFVGQENGKVTVRGVQPDGPAARAGIKRGDHIVAIDGRDTGELGQGALGFLTSGKPGATVTFMVASPGGGAPRGVAVTLEPFKPSPPRGTAPPAPTPAPSQRPAN
jgi:protocatechuate 3,4-dioxygenase beta subunit